MSMRYVFLFLILAGGISRGNDKKLEHLDSAIRSQLRVNAEILEKIEKYKREIEELNSDVKAQEDAAAALNSAEKRVEELQGSFLDLEDKLFDLAKIEEAYRTHFVPKIDLEPGRKVASFTDKKGISFSDVTISAVRNEKVSLKHSRGLSTIPATDLPEDLLEDSVLRPTDVYGPYKLAFEEIVNRRPREILNKAVVRELDSRKREARDRLVAEQRKQAESAYQARVREKEKASKAYLAERAAEYKAKAEKAAKLERAIAGYRQEVQTLLRQKRSVENQRAAKINDFNRAKVKPDRRAHDQEVSRFDATIKQLEASVRELDGKIKALYAEMR